MKLKGISLIALPKTLQANLSTTKEGQEWLQSLPGIVSDLTLRWSLTIKEHAYQDASASWAAPCMRANGDKAVLKIGWPHMEAKSEIDGLIFWDGDPTVELFDYDRSSNAILIERCEPGESLRKLSEEDQDKVISKILNQLWRQPLKENRFRPLSDMIEYWCQSALEDIDQKDDPILIKDGVELMKELIRRSADQAVLATDLHAGNILTSQRRAWLVIDPKPFVGDKAFDCTQHLLNCPDRMKRNPKETIERLAKLTQVDSKRISQWLWARQAIGI